MHPTLAVLTWSSLAALAAVLGVLPAALDVRLRLAWLGWSNALAAGLMLGAAYALMAAGLGDHVVAGGAGALGGVLFVHATHALTGTADLDLNRLDATDPAYGYQVILVDTLHAAHEGVAIGAAMAVSLPFGILVAMAFAVHNIPEAAILTSVLRARGMSLVKTALLAVATNVNQVLLAVATFAVTAAAPAALPWAVGFAVGALVHLVMVELMPESYREAGTVSIALVTVAAMGSVVLLVGGAW
ncbi:MAG: ZIP family metal transporter [Acidobacteriota bacterium]